VGPADRRSELTDQAARLGFRAAEDG